MFRIAIVEDQEETRECLHIPAAQGYLHGVLGPVSRTFKATLTDF